MTRNIKNIALFIALVCATTFAGTMQSIAQIGRVVSVTGYLYNEMDREAVNGVKVSFIDENNKATTSISHTGGKYFVTGLKPGKKYKITIEKPNFFQSEHEFEAPKSDKYEEISRDFLVKPMEVGSRLPLAVSPFDLKKSKIRPGTGEIVLDEIAKSLIMNPSVAVEISAFPDNADDKNANMALTLERCKAVQEYLVKAGVSVSRISTKSNAEIDPKNPLLPRKQAKGKRYIGKVYVTVAKI